MRSTFVVSILAIVMGFPVGVCAAADAPPGWAYAIPPAPPAGAPAPAPAPPDTSLKHLAGSTFQFTRAQISDAFGPAVWYPSDHPALPDLVAHARRPDVPACCLCHSHNGK